MQQSRSLAVLIEIINVAVSVECLHWGFLKARKTGPRHEITVVCDQPPELLEPPEPHPAPVSLLAPITPRSCPYLGLLSASDKIPIRISVDHFCASGHLHFTPCSTFISSGTPGALTRLIKHQKYRIWVILEPFADSHKFALMHEFICEWWCSLSARSLVAMSPQKSEGLNDTPDLCCEI